MRCISIGSPLCKPSYAVAVLYSSLAMLCHAGPPPYASVSVLHTTERDMFLQAGGGSLYDTNGMVNGTTGDLFHSSMAYTVGWIGDANCRVDDTMLIPFPFSVTRSDYYDISVSGTVTVGIYDVGQNSFLVGSHWGDFAVSVRHASIRDLTTGSLVYGDFDRTIYYEKTGLWTALEPALWDSVMLILKQYYPLVHAGYYVQAADKLKEVYDTLDSVANAKQTITTNFTTTVAVYLEAGHTYRVEPHIDSTVAASSVDLIAGGHFSGVKGTMHISDFSVVSRTPNYTLSVQSSGATGVSISASPADANGSSSGSTPKTFTYLSGTAVSLTAPSTVGTKVFSGWSGVDNESGNVGYVTMNANRPVTALYSDTSVSVTITAPTTSPTWTTASDRIFLHGTASSLVTNVTWQNTTRGTSGTADGTTSWGTSGISLNTGANSITVTALDSFGRTATDSITVTYDDSAKEVIIYAHSKAMFLSGTPNKNYAGDLDVGFADPATTRNIRSLIQFSLSNVPPGSIIQSARLGLRLDHSNPTSDPPPISICASRARESWSQNDVDWNNQPGPTTSDGPCVSVGSARREWSYWDVGAIVSGWWSGAFPNCGFKLASNVENSSGINVRVFDNDTLRVIYVPERVLPTITINSPTTSPSLFYTNASASINLAGVSSDNYTVASVSWNNATTGQSGSASGTLSWTASVTLTQGWNAVTVTATDSANNKGTDTIDVYYVVPDTTAPTVPNIVLATSLSSTQAKITWSPSTDTGGSGFKEYRIYRNSVLRTNTQFLTFTDTSLSGSSSYCYTVAAADNAANESLPSTAACVSTAAPARPSLALIQPQSGSMFAFRLTFPTGYTYIVESSVDLQTWTYVTSLASTNGTVDITLTKPPGLPRNFYRARFVP